MTALITLLFVAACGDDDDGSTATSRQDGGSVARSSPRARSTCSPAGLEFSTELTSCDEAMRVAASIVDPAGQATADGINILVGTICSAIQQTAVEMTSTREDIRLAGQLSAAGVCPGDTSILTPKD